MLKAEGTQFNARGLEEATQALSKPKKKMI